MVKKLIKEIVRGLINIIQSLKYEAPKKIDLNELETNSNVIQVRGHSGTRASSGSGKVRSLGGLGTRSDQWKAKADL